MPTTMTRTFQAYEYHELSDRAKEKVQEWLWQGNHDWWDPTYDDFVLVAACFGITISTKARQTQGKTPRTIHDPEIWFSSHPWSAGYSGTFSLLDAATCEQKIKAHCEDELLLKMAAVLAADIAQFAVVGMQHIIEHGGCTLQITGNEYGVRNVEELELEESLAEAWDGDEVKRNALHGLNATIDATAKDLARWLEKQLRAEEEYQRSDEFCRETCEANEYKFEEDGTLIS